MVLVDTQALYSSLFALFMGRELSDVDYKLHFSRMDVVKYIACLLDSPEFIQINLAPVIDCSVLPIVNNQLLSRVRDEPDCLENSVPSIVLYSRTGETRRERHSLVVPLRYYAQTATPSTPHNPAAQVDEAANGSSSSTSVLMACGSVDILQAKATLVSLLTSMPSFIDRDVIETSSYSLECLLLPVCQTFRRYSLFASLFQSLLDRPLTRDEYDVHFSTLNTLQFLCLLLKSSECLAKKIFEVLPTCTLSRVLNSQQLQVQVSGALDEGVYIVLSISYEREVSLAIRIRSTSSIILPASDSESLPLSELASFVDSLVASAIKDNSFSQEDFISTVRLVAADADVDSGVLINLQTSYQLPEFCGLITTAAKCRVALVCASQLGALSDELAAVEHSVLLIAH
jgi:hypothetical protein